LIRFEEDKKSPPAAFFMPANQAGQKKGPDPRKDGPLLTYEKHQVKYRYW
jgi:hypothetical protein